MRLLMETFWGAYVGHCMNKQTCTVRGIDDLHARDGCGVYVPRLAVSTPVSTCNTHRGPREQRQSRVVLYLLSVCLRFTRLWTWPLRALALIWLDEPYA